MSGRVRVILADGRRVTGYRKTLTQRARRTPMHLLPDWRLSFELPGTLGLGVASYPGIVGVHVWPCGHVEIAGKNKPWLFGQAVALLKLAAPDGLPQPINVRITRAAEPGPTLSGPFRRAHDRVHKIAFDGRHATLIGEGAVRSERRIA